MLVRHTAGPAVLRSGGWLWLSLSLIPHPGDRTGCEGVVRVGCGWVEHETDRRLEKESSAHCWVLRRHLLVGVFSGCSWSGSSNASRCAREFGRVWVGVVVVGEGWGVVVC